MSEKMDWPETVVIFDKEEFDGEWMPKRLADAITWLSDKLETVPAECRETATIEVDSESGYEGSHYGHIRITYERSATPEDIATRIEASRRHASTELAWARQRAEAALLRLKEIDTPRTQSNAKAPKE